MPAGRSNRVLFDLIPQRDAEPSRAASKPPAKPVVRVELKPQDAPRTTAAPRSADPRPAEPAVQPQALPRPEPRSVQELPRAAGTPYAKPERPAFRCPAFLGTSALPIPLNLIYLSVALLIGVCVVIYLVGFGAGKSKAESDLAGATRLDEPPVVEPSANSPRLLPQTPNNTPPAASPNTQGPTSGRQGNTPVTPPVSSPAPAGAILTVRGPVMTDPRVAELNYLSLASLGEEDAKAAITFLAANGVDAIGVPRVDPGSGRANNQGPTQVFRIYALPGITRDEYAKKLTARTKLEAAVAEIGARWQRDHRGASNFARTQWEKFKP